MATNATGTRREVGSDGAVGVEPTSTSTSVTNPTGVEGVAVYDREPDTTSGSVRPSGSMFEDPAPATTRSTGSVIAWIIGLVILVVLIYFLWQMFF